ncbi:MAG: hypothetical protein R6V31_10785 [Halohasta sp.]
MKPAVLFGLLAVVSLAVGSLAAPAVASSPPEPVCGPCGSAFEERADQQGVAVNVTHSTAEIRVDENGSATWIVTNRLGEANASGLAATPERLRQVARGAAVDEGLAAESDGSITVQSATVDNGTVRVRFTDPDAASRHAGVLVADYFHSIGTWGAVLNADRVSITGPEGTVVANDPRAIVDDEHATDSELPTVDEGTLTWQRTASADDPAELYDEFYIAFAEPETGSTRVDAALTLASLPIWLSNVRDIVLPGAVVYGLVSVGLAAATRWTVETPTDAGRFAAAVAGAGVLGALAAAVGLLPATLLGVGVLYAEIGLAGLVRPDWLRSVRGALAVGLAALLAVGGILLGLGAVDPRFADLAPTVAHAMAIHLPLAVAPAFGVGVLGGGLMSRSTAAAVAGAIVAFVVAGGAFVPFDSRPFFLILFVLPFIVALLGLIVLPLSVLAAGYAEPDGTA